MAALWTVLVVALATASIGSGHHPVDCDPPTPPPLAVSMVEQSCTSYVNTSVHERAGHDIEVGYRAVSVHRCADYSVLFANSTHGCGTAHVFARLCRPPYVRVQRVIGALFAECTLQRNAGRCTVFGGPLPGFGTEPLEQVVYLRRPTGEYYGELAITDPRHFCIYATYLCCCARTPVRPTVSCNTRQPAALPDVRAAHWLDASYHVPPYECVNEAFGIGRIIPVGPPPTRRPPVIVRPPPTRPLPTRRPPPHVIVEPPPVIIGPPLPPLTRKPAVIVIPPPTMTVKPPVVIVGPPPETITGKPLEQNGGWPWYLILGLILLILLIVALLACCIWWIVWYFTYDEVHACGAAGGAHPHGAGYTPMLPMHQQHQEQQGAAVCGGAAGGGKLRSEPYGDTIERDNGPYHERIQFSARRHYN